jgi:hypothetical protein
MAIETKGFRLLSVAHLLKGAMRLVDRQGGSALLGRQPQEEQNGKAQQHKGAIKEPLGKGKLAHCGSLSEN